jgi:hypothetical protein
MKRQWYFPVAKRGEYESQVMNALTNQARKMPINQKCRQLSPLGKVYHMMMKAPVIPMQIGEIEKRRIKVVLRQSRPLVMYRVFHGRNV